ncbi:glycerophosphodiester phosphodiesterase family protein [Roseovarius aestuariivivens]|uniref:glycerophosphodiester phosphodiesterase family protein n=1 Tax=Roseovarius aestuariivivens TaxID=1888910 RepID=UPI00107FE2EF|nr:glycerophosphodiester phosphodiesterase family protein [Roseovarius aestuariivivens]
MRPLDPVFLRRPLAHRALHDAGRDRPENSRAAVAAALSHGYGVELDLQPSRDGVAMVFHDQTLDRLTDETGAVRDRKATELDVLALAGGPERIPHLSDVLDQVAGRVPVLLELKDQHGTMGRGDGVLEEAVARDLKGYRGPVAVMSFNPEMMARMAEICPEVPRGLVTSSYTAAAWPDLPRAVRERLRDIPDYARVGASYISHEAADLDRPDVARLHAAGAAVLCWTIRSAAEEARARRIADNITFEGYLPAIPA